MSWSSFLAGFIAGIAALVGLTVQSIPFKLVRPLQAVDDFQYHKPVPWPIWNAAMSVLPRLQHAPKALTPPAFAWMEDAMTAAFVGIMCNMAELNVASVLSQHSSPEGGMPLHELADKIDIKRVDILGRLIQLMSLRGYFYMDANQNVYNTPMSTYLQTNNDTIADYLCFQRRLNFQIDANPVSSEFIYGRNIEAGASLDSNLIAFLKQEQQDELLSPTGMSLKGQEFWDVLDHYGKRPAFDNFMAFLTNANPTHYDYPFDKNCDVVVDVGGGKGHVLYSIMDTYPTIQKGILFDLETQVFRAKEYWRSQPNDRLVEKAEFAVGDFFNVSTFPARQEGRTCYVMRQILHDWNDASCLKILINLASKMRNDDLLLLNEMLPNDEVDRTDMYRMASDLVMIFNHDAKERSFTAMNELLGNAGLEAKRLYETRSPFRWAEAVKTNPVA